MLKYLNLKGKKKGVQGQAFLHSTLSCVELIDDDKVVT